MFNEFNISSSILILLNQNQSNNRVDICQRFMTMNYFQFATQVQSKQETFTWRRIVTFGAEGTEAGNFCRPWGVAIARYSDLSILFDPWAYSDQETSATSASSSTDTFNDWNRAVGVGLTESVFDTRHAPGQDAPINIDSDRINNNTSSTWSQYLIGIADRSNNRIQLFKFDAIRQTVTFLHMFGDGPGARHGQFDRPAGLVFNSKLEQIIVSDKDNHRVQVFDMSGSFLFKFGERGSKSGQFCYPWDIDICKTTHNIIVSDTRNRRVQMFNNTGRYLAHFNQPLDSPRGVAFLTPTQLVVSDFNKHRLLIVAQTDDNQVSSSTSFMSAEKNYLITHNHHQASNNPPTKPTPIDRPQLNQQLHESKFVGLGEGSSWGEFLRPQGVTSNGSTIFCSDSRNNRVACWDRETGNFNYIGTDTLELDRPAGLASIDNYIVIVDFGNNRVHICQRLMAMNYFQFATQAQSKQETFTWRRIVTFGAEGTEAGNFCRPWGVAIARYSDLSILFDPWAYSDQETSATSASSSTDTFNDWNRAVGVGLTESVFGTRFAPGQETPSNIDSDSINNNTPSTWSQYLIGIADRSNNRIQLFKFDAIRQTVTFLHMFGDGPGARHGQFDRPAGLVFNSKLEQIIVSDKDNHRVQVFDMSGSFLFKFGERGSKSGQFCYPWDIDICKTTHNIIVSDTRNRRVQMFNNLGRYLAHFNQPLDSPRGVAFLTPTQLVVSDFNKHRLLIVAQNDDKSSASSTSLIRTNEKNYLITHNHHQASNNPPTKSASVDRPQLNQQLHESRFVGLGEGSSWGEFLRPQGVTSNGSTVFCSDSRNNRVASWDKETESFSYIGGEVVKLDRPAGLAAIDNYIVIVDFGNNRVHICQRFMATDYFQFS